MALLALKALEEKYPKTKMTFGWVAMRRRLLGQASRENERIGVKNIHFISMFEKNPPQCDVMITDEAHHDAASTCATLHSKMQAKWALGLTGTPYRTDRVKLAFETIVDDCGVRFLIEQGYLSQFHQYAIPEWTPDKIAGVFTSDPARWGKSIIYMNTRELCLELNNKLCQAGIKSATVFGSTPFAEQDRLYTEFENGDLQCLINVYLLSEGFDCPDLETVWVRDSCKLCTIQMAGRVLRKYPEIPFKKIVQSERTSWPYTKTANAKREFIWTPSGWRGLEPGEQVDTISSMIREAILPRPIQLPQYLQVASSSLKVLKDGKIQLRKNMREKNSYSFWEKM